MIPLTENYRSIQTILDASRQVIRNNSESLEKALNLDKQLTKNITTPERPIEIVVSPDPQVEIAALVEKIQ